MLVFAPRPSDQGHDAGSLSATVLSPTVELAQAPAAAPTATVTVLAVLVTVAALVAVARRWRRADVPVLVRRDEPLQHRPPRRGPPSSSR